MKSRIKEYFLKAKNNEIVALSFFGAVSAFGFSPFNLFFLSLIGFAAYFVVFEKTENVKRAVTGTFAFSFWFHFISLYWLAFPLLVDAKRHAFLIPFAVTIAPAYLSLFWSLPAFFVKKYKTGIWQHAFALAALLSLSMYFYGHYCPGFPWVYIGYIWSFCKIFQTLSLFGIYGLNFLTILVSFAVGIGFIAFRSKDKFTFRIALGSFVLLTGSMFVFGSWRLSCNQTEYTSYNARMVQGNLSQREKMDKRELFTNLQTHIALSEHTSHIDFIIWPEASIPYLYRENSWKINRLLKSPLSFNETLIAGAVRQDIVSLKVFNSVIVVNCFGENIENYDKIRLVPFGEYMPLRQYVPWHGLASAVDDFDRGTVARIVNINGLKVIFAICYEAVFPQDFIPKDERADVIINVTNDAWFGYTTEPYQHLQIVRARAIENGLPMIRATNFGISAVFDAVGRQICVIPMGKRGFADFVIPKNIPTTPYGKFGDRIFFIMIFIGLGVAFSVKRRKA